MAAATATARARRSHPRAVLCWLHQLMVGLTLRLPGQTLRLLGQTLRLPDQTSQRRLPGPDKINLFAPWLKGLGHPLGAKGVRVRPGTPRDPKSYFFVTNRVGIQPFCKPLGPADAELRRGSRQMGPTPSISIFFDIFWVQKLENCIFALQ